MDFLYTMLVIGGLVFFCVIALFHTVNQRYPVRVIDVYDRGVKQRINYRLAGTTIVENNIFKLLLNHFNICGDIRMLEFDIMQGKVLGIIPMGLTRVYRAYRRHDYLFALRHVNTTKTKRQLPDGSYTEDELTKQPPVIIVQNKKGENTNIKATFSDNGLLMPLNIVFANEKLKEIEVANGKAICTRFIESDKSVNQLTDASNPIVTTLLMALPLLLVVIANGVVVYLILSAVTDDVTRITEMQKQIAELLSGMV